MLTFQMTFFMNNQTNIVMNDMLVPPLAKTLPSLVTNCDEIFLGWLKYGWKITW
jgi:hypothetical protein